MKEILNLDFEFTPFGEGIPIKIFDFPSGCEPHVKLLTKPKSDEVHVTCRIRSTKDIIVLMLAVDALRNSGVKKVSLTMPYIPFARQDRMMVDGEPISIRVFASLINSMNLDEVNVYDPHSDVSVYAINNCKVTDNHNFVGRVLMDKNDYLLISPDAGAYKKIFKLAQYLNYRNDIVLCNKARNVDTGEIVSISCSYSDLGGQDCYIVDDICDGGGTFILLAKELIKRNAGNVYLIVSHGIFSKGYTLEGVDHVYTTNSFSTIKNTPLITQYSI
jgi:ribose-phosphate pyrophosphokinase